MSVIVNGMNNYLDLQYQKGFAVADW